MVKVQRMRDCDTFICKRDIMLYALFQKYRDHGWGRGRKTESQRRWINVRKQCPSDTTGSSQQFWQHTQILPKPDKTLSMGLKRDHQALPLAEIYWQLVAPGAVSSLRGCLSWYVDRFQWGSHTQAYMGSTSWIWWVKNKQTKSWVGKEGDGLWRSWGRGNMPKIHCMIFSKN